MSEDYLGVPLGREDVLFLAEIRSFLSESLESSFFDGTISRLEAQRAWQDKLHQANLAAISWPIEYGGRAATPVQQLLFATEIAKHRAPEPINRSAINQLGPTIIQWGTAEQRARLLPRILSGEDVWCQGFSEPDAGSDLASLRTSARLDDDSFVVNGTKVWTSKAHYADWIYALVRTDEQAEQHAGISFLLIDLRMPGVEITPIRQITGDAEFNEVRFTDVQVPATNLLGDLHDGWRVATTTLGFERVGQSRTHRIERRLGHVVRLALEPDAEGHRSIDDDAVAHRLADYAARVEGLRFIGAQATAAEVLGEASLPSASVAKLLTSEVDQEMADFGLDLAAIGGLLGRGSPGAAKNGAVSASYLLMRAATLGAGTSEMQRNVIGEKLLGLSRDH